METTALLTRLASKPGVQSTLVLSRKDGSIISTSGLISQPSMLSPSPTSTASMTGAASPNSGSLAGPADTETGVTESMNISDEGRGVGSIGMKGAEQTARMIWAFVQAAGGLVIGLDPEEEVKLLRLRTKQQELVIVPDSNFLLVVIHDTPRA
ncbi:hypothetical protein MMC16_007803 [Acarospora aff. strigata]|nr:hypothetical protein [Acarospora aff. strigata]